MKILLLCHGNKHIIHNIYIVPFSIKYLRDCTTLDINKNSEPDIVEDFRNKTKLKSNTFDIIHGVFCQYSIYINDDGVLVDNYFKNLTKILKTDGYFFLCNIPLFVAFNFAKFLLNEKMFLTDNIKKHWSNKPLPNAQEITLLSKTQLKYFIDYKENVLPTFKEKKLFNNFMKKRLILNQLFVLYIQFIYPQFKLVTNNTKIIKIITDLNKKYSSSSHQIQPMINQYINDKNNPVNFIFKLNK